MANDHTSLYRNFIKPERLRDAFVIRNNPHHQAPVPRQFEQVSLPEAHHKIVAQLTTDPWGLPRGIL